MHKEWTEASERLEVEQKLNYLVRLLQDKVDWENPCRYIILEYFPKETDNIYEYKPNVYPLFNITATIGSDGLIYFDDFEGILEENMYANTPLPLQSIIVDSVIYVALQNDDRKITISLDYGYIQIYY